MSKYIACASIATYTTLYTLYSPTNLTIFDAEDGHQLRRWTLEANPRGFAFNTDATRACVILDHQLFIYDVESDTIITTIGVWAILTNFSFDSLMLVVMTRDRMARIYNVFDGQELATWKLRHTHPYKAINFTPCCNLIVTLSINGEISFCDVMTGVSRYHFGGVPSTTNCVLATLHCYRLACYCSQGSLSVFDLPPPTASATEFELPTARASQVMPMQKFRKDTGKEISTLTIDGLGCRVAFGAIDGSISVLDAITGDKLYEVSDPAFNVMSRWPLSIGFNGDGGKVIVRHCDQTIVVYDTRCCGMLFQLPSEIRNCVGVFFVGEDTTFLLK